MWLKSHGTERRRPPAPAGAIPLHLRGNNRSSSDSSSACPGSPNIPRALPALLQAQAHRCDVSPRVTSSPSERPRGSWMLQPPKKASEQQHEGPRRHQRCRAAEQGDLRLRGPCGCQGHRLVPATALGGHLRRDGASLYLHHPVALSLAGFLGAWGAHRDVSGALQLESPQHPPRRAPPAPSPARPVSP